METTKEQIGVVSVDSGLIMVGDPCYHLGKTKQPEAFCNSWEAFIYERLTKDGKPLMEVQLDHDSGNEGLAVVCGSFGGDGCYPVYAEKDKFGVTQRLIVEFA